MAESIKTSFQRYESIIQLNPLISPHQNEYMKIKILLVFLLLSSIGQSFAQDALFGTDSTRKPKYGFILNGNVGGDLPLADMAKRFGNSMRFGPAITYKTRKNYIWGVKADFITGSLIKEDSLLMNVRDKYSVNTFNGKFVEAINNSGERVGLPVYERGYLLGVQFGKIFSFSKENPDNGLTLITSAGFIQHKITIYNNNSDVPAVLGDYVKGYDRLTNGWFVGEFVGYSYFAKNKFVNFNIGVDATLAVTKCRRDFLYDVMRADDKQRLDVLLGLRAGWMIPIFRHKSEDILFE